MDPVAPTLNERAKKDTQWNPSDRIEFARNTIRALMELHTPHKDNQKIVHRNLTPSTFLVRYDNTPILTGFNFTKIPNDVSIASVLSPSYEWNESAAPEIKTLGLSAADHRSDVYSLCKSLCLLFDGYQDEKCRQAFEILKTGLVDNPDERSDLTTLDSKLSAILGESLPPPPPPPTRFWTEDQEIIFNDYKYRIINRLGSGGIGVTYKVVKIDKSTNEDLGTYVAKIVYSKDNGDRSLRAYNLAQSHLGSHAGLSTIFEVAKEWQENNFVALMKWIDGTPLNEFIGVFPLLAEEYNEFGTESLAIRWLRSMCDALDVLHRNGLIHGDVSPKNMIITGSELVLTDYDFVGKIGELIQAPGTKLYSSPSCQEQRPASPSDDIYALAASFFHVVFDKEPFQNLDKRNGLNWGALPQDEYPHLIEFLNRATDPDPDKRFLSALDAIKYLDKLTHQQGQATTDDYGKDVVQSIYSPHFQQQLAEPVELREEQVDWLLSLLQSYPGSELGNQETRGLDSDFAMQTYVETNLETTLLQDIRERNVRLVILCGNAGDGKTALLQHIASELGLGKHSSSERILEGTLQDGLTVRMNLDGSASWRGRSADELLNDFLTPFQHGTPVEDIVHLLAINDGRLLEWIENSEETQLTDDLYSLLQDEEENKMEQVSYIRFISMNQRSLVGGITEDRSNIDTSFLERLLDQLYGGEKAAETDWAVRGLHYIADSISLAGVEVPDFLANE